MRYHVVNEIKVELFGHSSLMHSSFSPKIAIVWWNNPNTPERLGNINKILRNCLHV